MSPALAALVPTGSKANSEPRFQIKELRRLTDAQLGWKNELDSWSREAGILKNVDGLEENLGLLLRGRSVHPSDGASSPPSLHFVNTDIHQHQPDGSSGGYR